MSKHRRSPFIILSSILCGVLLWMSWPERGLTPLIFVAWVPLFFAEHRFSTIQKNKKTGRMFGNFFLALLTWNLLTTWWIYFASGVGSIVAIALNSFFMAIVWQLFFSVKTKHGAAIGYISLIIFWIAFEYLHFNWEISWPWLTLGNVFATHPAWIQWYEYTGVLGGSVWILIVNIVIFQLLKNLWYRDLLYKIRKINVLLISLLIFILLASPIIFSLNTYYNHEDAGEPVNIVLLQPNVDPYNEKFKSTDQQLLSSLLRLASTTVDENTDYCIGPETAIPTGIWEEDIDINPSTQSIKKLVEQYPDLNIILGLTSFRSYHEGDNVPLTARKSKAGEYHYDVFNAALLINEKDRVQLYHKSRLVPGVEKMPYPKIFGFLENYAIELGGTSGSLGTQTGRNNFYAKDFTRVAPSICYESIYGGFMAAYMRDTAEFISIITNDGWWSNTAGFRQHLNYARLLSIEFRKSIARSANTGISCFINQRGDIVEHTSWWTEETLKGQILKNKNVTFYALHGDYIGFACAFLAVSLLIYLIFRTIIDWF